jgi:predicted RND superfamily exporter protein
MRYKWMSMLVTLLLFTSSGWVQDSVNKPDTKDKVKQETMKRELDDLRAKRREMDKRIAELERQLGVKPDPKAEQAMKEVEEALKRAQESLKKAQPYMHFWKERPDGQVYQFQLPDEKDGMRSFFYGPEAMKKLQEKLKELPDNFFVPYLKDLPMLKELPEGLHELPDNKGLYYYYRITPDDKEPRFFQSPDSKKFMMPFENDKQWHDRLEMLEKLLQDQPSKQDEKAWKDWLKRLQELVDSWKKV